MSYAKEFLSDRRVNLFPLKYEHDARSLFYWPDDKANLNVDTFAFFIHMPIIIVRKKNLPDEKSRHGRENNFFCKKH